MFDRIFELPTAILLLISISISLCITWYSAWSTKWYIRGELLMLGLTEIKIRWLWWKTTRDSLTFQVSYRDQGGVYHQTECLSTKTAFNGRELFWQESPMVGGAYRANPLLQRRR